MREEQVGNLDMDSSRESRHALMNTWIVSIKRNRA